MFKDPAVLFTKVYTALIYYIYYSFFGVFPLVDSPLYGSNNRDTGVVFTSIIVSCIPVGNEDLYYLRYMLIPDIPTVVSVLRDINTTSVDLCPGPSGRTVHIW